MIAPDKISAVILAAGSSSRLGQPKQLVNFRGRSLLQHTIDTVNHFDFEEKVLILGKESTTIQKSTQTNDFRIIENKHWQEGMASSIRVGVQQASTNPQIEHLLILLSDQPFLSISLIQQLIERHEDMTISASSYSNIIGVPAIFSKKYFHELMHLTGDQGARKVIKAHSANTKTAPFHRGDFDVDTPLDLAQLRQLDS